MYKSLLNVFGCLIIILVGYYLYQAFFKKDYWTLMICESLMPNGVECYENSYVLEGYDGQNQCMEAGIRISGSRGFECGKNCREDEYGLRVCNIICNKSGCSD